MADGMLTTIASVALVIVVVVIAAMALTAVLAVRLGRRLVRRGVPAARRLATDAALRARARGRPGPGGQIAQTRVALRASLARSRSVLAAGHQEDRQLGEALGLLARLDQVAAGVDADLATLEREPDQGRAHAVLPAVQARAERIREAADSLRWAAQERSGAFHDHDLGRLCEEAAIEAGVLRAAPKADAVRLPQTG